MLLQCRCYAGASQPLYVLGLSQAMERFLSNLMFGPNVGAAAELMIVCLNEGVRYEPESPEYGLGVLHPGLQWKLACHLGPKSKP